MNTTPVPSKSLQRLRAALVAREQADQMLRAQVATVAEMLELDPTNPLLVFNADEGVFVLPEEGPDAAATGPD